MAMMCYGWCNGNMTMVYYGGYGSNMVLMVLSKMYGVAYLFYGI